MVIVNWFIASSRYSSLVVFYLAIVSPFLLELPVCVFDKLVPYIVPLVSAVVSYLYSGHSARQIACEGDQPSGGRCV